MNKINIVDLEEGIDVNVMVVELNGGESVRFYPESDGEGGNAIDKQAIMRYIDSLGDELAHLYSLYLVNRNESDNPDVKKYFKKLWN